MYVFIYFTCVYLYIHDCICLFVYMLMYVCVYAYIFPVCCYTEHLNLRRSPILHLAIQPHPEGAVY